MSRQGRATSCRSPLSPAGAGSSRALGPPSPAPALASRSATLQKTIRDSWINWVLKSIPVHKRSCCLGSAGPPLALPVGKAEGGCGSAAARPAAREGRGAQGEALPAAGYAPSGTLSLCASYSSCCCWAVSSLIRDTDMQTYANTHRNTFCHCKMRILKLQPDIETVYCSFVVTCLPTRIFWSLTVCLASPGPTAIPRSRLSSSDLA